MHDGLLFEIDGEGRSIPPHSNIRELLRFLGIGEERIAVEVNHRIVRHKKWEATPLSNMDKVEIVQFVGGG
jgi:thiamine biosynthesis protein ThiS